MTPDELYQKGYDDGRNGKAASPAYVDDTNYSLGYEDGKGDRARHHAVADDYDEQNAPPPGFAFTGEKRVPEPYEWYLSKAGNATYLERERRNAQTRHILTPDQCICGDYPKKKCGIHHRM
jgi:hypothetical protein